jgi:hypothetical protein
MIFNLDEMCWSPFGGPRSVLFQEGVETVEIRSARGERQSSAAVGTISASDSKLPMWILANNKRVQCGKEFGVHLERHIRAGCDTRPGLLVPDMFAAHRPQRLMDLAGEHKVELLFVPGDPPI